MGSRISLVVFGLSAFLLANFGSVSALTIEGNFIGGQELGPSIGGGNIVDIFRAAADMWELAIRDNFVVTFDYGWGPTPGGTHTLLAQGGTPNRETRGQILVNPQVYADGSFGTLFLDPTPRQSEEFPAFSQRTQDIGGGSINVERRFSAPIGDQSPLFQDLLTIFLHEIGHGLGLSNANISFMAESQDGKIDVSPPLPFAGTTIPLAFNNFGVTSHIDLYGPVMDSLGFNVRVLPSSLDVLAVAQLSGFQELNLDLNPPDEFPIATTTGREMAVSAAFDGTSYLVGIQGDAAAHDDITAQLVSQSGTLSGSRISVGHTGGVPYVAFDGTNYLMAWQDCGPSTCNDNLYGQLISKSGASVGAAFVINQSTVQDIWGLSFGDGHYLVVYGYQNQDDSVGLHGRIISPSGTVGNEIAIGTAGGPSSGLNSVAFDGTNFLMVWDTTTTIKGRFIGTNGNLSGSEFTVRSKQKTQCDFPVNVAFDGTNYLVVWRDNFDPCGGDYFNGTGDLFGQIVTPSGSLSGGVINISVAPGDQILPSIAFDGTNYLVAWMDLRNDTNHNNLCDAGEGTCWDIYGQYVSKAGALVGSEFVINNDAGNQFGGVTGFNNGKYFVLVNNVDKIDGTVGDVYGVFLRISPPIISGLVDFDGDGATDVTAFHLPSDQFFTDYSGNLGQFGWGGSNSMPLIWDYDGDGKTDVSIYHIPTNQWFVKGVGNLGQFGWGGEESVPVPGDYNGNGRMQRAFYHSPTNRWFVEGQDPVTFGWNGAECIPVPGDYDGDGKTDMVIYHIPSNQWFQYGVGNLGQFGWGGADCIPVPGDYNGDGITEIAVYHVPTNQWFVKGIGNLGQYGWGGLESFPIPGDYNGDGKIERGFYRPSENRWFIEGESDFVWGWGGSDFMPITSQIAVYNWFRFVLGRFQ